MRMFDRRVRATLAAAVTLFVTIPRAAHGAQMQKTFTVGLEGRQIIAPNAKYDWYETPCYHFVLPPGAIFATQQCNTSISLPNSYGRASFMYISIHSLVSEPGYENADRALGKVFSSLTKPQPGSRATIVLAPTHRHLNRPSKVPYYGAAFAMNGTTTPVCVQTVTTPKACTNETTAPEAVFLFFADAPNRYLLNGRPLAVFSVQCILPRDGNYETVYRQCNTVVGNLTMR